MCYTAIDHFRVGYSLCENESLCETILHIKIRPPTDSFSCRSNSFHDKDFAQGLVLKQRHKVTQNGTLDVV